MANVRHEAAALGWRSQLKDVCSMEGLGLAAKAHITEDSGCFAIPTT
jgi:hypothetical protein